METAEFPRPRGVIFREVKEGKGFRGDVLLYVAQGILRPDAEIAEKGPFGTGTGWLAAAGGEAQETGGGGLVFVVVEVTLVMHALERQLHVLLPAWRHLPSGVKVAVVANR